MPDTGEAGVLVHCVRVLQVVGARWPVLREERSRSGDQVAVGVPHRVRPELRVRAIDPVRRIKIDRRAQDVREDGTAQHESRRLDLVSAGAIPIDDLPERVETRTRLSRAVDQREPIRKRGFAVDLAGRAIGLLSGERVKGARHSTRAFACRRHPGSEDEQPLIQPHRLVHLFGQCDGLIPLAAAEKQPRIVEAQVAKGASLEAVTCSIREAILVELALLGGRCARRDEREARVVVATADRLVQSVREGHVDAATKVR